LHIYLDTSSLTYLQYQYNFALFIGTNPNPDPSNTTLSPLNEFIQSDGNGAYTLLLDRSNLGGIGGQAVSIILMWEPLTATSGKPRNLILLLIPALEHILWTPKTASLFSPILNWHLK
jgi:hypothetical protein